MRKDVRKGKIIIGLLLLIGIIGVGYATLGANLKINGVAEVPSSSWNVHFKTGSIVVTDGSVSIEENTTQQTATIDSATQVSYAVKLALPGDFYEFTVDVENTGTIDAMIESISSKLGNTEITTGTLPSYLDYNVTYSDGVPITAKQILEADGGTETIKVRLEFKKDIEATDLPGEATTLNLNFQINYVQADDTATPVIHPFTGIKYGAYPYNNRLTLNSSVPSNAILHLNVYDALADWSNEYVMNHYDEPFYLKHVIENDIVKQSYVGFEVFERLANNNPEMTAGLYELRGGVDETSLGDGNQPIFIQNAKTIYDAYGTKCEENPYTTIPSSSFSCNVYGLRVGALSNGNVFAISIDSDGCHVYDTGISYCSW